MKYILASDIHGSSYWCEKLLAFFQKENAEKLVLLGDLLYHGPRNPFPEKYDTKKVYEMLNAWANSLICVRGNCDSEVDQMVLSFPMMDDYKALPLGKRTLYLTHGHLHEAEKAFIPLQTGDLQVNGHFHVPTFKRLENGVLYANCGSVGLPKDGSPHSCMVLTEESLEWIDLSTSTSFHKQRLQS